MKNKDTAFDTIKSILLKKKVVDNYWAIDSRVTTRLSDCIFRLRNSGYKITTVRGHEIPNCKAKNRKNTYYFLD